MMNCRNARFSLGLLVGQDLESHAEPQVRRHLAECPQCRNHWQALQTAAAALTSAAATPAVAPPHESLWPRLERQLRRRAEPARAPGAAGWLPVAVLAAACVAVVVTSGQTPVFNLDLAGQLASGENVVVGQPVSTLPSPGTMFGPGPGVGIDTVSDAQMFVIPDAAGGGVHPQTPWGGALLVPIDFSYSRSF